MHAVLSVNKPDKSMAFPGYMPQGGNGPVMKTDVHDLVNGEASPPPLVAEDRIWMIRP